MRVSQGRDLSMSKAGRAMDVEEPRQPDDGAIEGQREISDTELKAIAEALIFVADEPISPKSIADVLKLDRDAVETAISDLAREYEARNGGLQLPDIAGAWQIPTPPKHHQQIR